MCELQSSSCILFFSLQKGLVVVGESVYPFESADGNDHTCRTNLWV